MTAKDLTLIPCAVKGTMVHKWVCLGGRVYCKTLLAIGEDMKIIEIKRTVSDMNYNNTSATATLSDGEDPIKAAIELDAKIKEMMAGIADKTLAVEDFRREKAEAVNILQAALDHAQKQDIPF